jgi:23S rRNA A2030 N6-methylase RlmJ
LELEEQDPENAAFPLYESLKACRQTCFPKKAQAESKYFGSSGMVREMLDTANIRFQFRLWDSDLQVVNSLSRSYSDYPDIVVTQGDGYTGLQSLEHASLALIDPISIQDDQASILATMSHLEEHGIPFLCWVPLFGDEEALFNHFEDEAKKSYATLRVTWQVREGSTWGCQLMVSSPYATLLHEICRDVCEVMNAKPWTVRTS